MRATVATASVSVKSSAESVRPSCCHEAQLVAAERPVVVGEADAAVELRVAREAFLEAGHADQDDGDRVAIEEVAQLLEAGGLEAVGFVDDDQLDVPGLVGEDRVAAAVGLEVVFDDGAEAPAQRRHLV
jgi:predicted transcriptional regulator